MEERLLLAAIGNNLSVGDELRNYRIAIAATAEYTAFMGSQAAALTAIQTFVSDLNSIFEPELSVHFDLVSGINSIYTNAATDPFTNGDTSAMLSQNAAALNSTVGAANYDIGHAFGTAVSGGGGLASLGVVGSSFKAQGASVSSNPQGSSWLGLVAHEIGHQFGAEHSFNGIDSNCGPGREAGDAYEPASGTTLMSYAGICGTDDLQSGEDSYFHSASFESIETLISTVPAAAPNSTTGTGNNIPTINGGSDFTIPANTPFELSASGADADNGDTLTYTWEQLDLGPAQSLPLSDLGTNPLFRSFLPSQDPTRTFPRLSDLLANNSTAGIGEVLPSTNRSLNFRATVRDGNNGINSDDVLLSVVDTGSVFAVTAPNTAVSFTGGTSQTISWNVAGTDGNGIDAANVVISLSIDGGLTYPFDLATTANDGSEFLNIPNVDTTSARIRVKGDGNVFFDVSDVNFAVVANASAAGISFAESGDSTRPVEGGSNDSYQLMLNTAPAGNVTITVTAEPDTLVSVNGASFAATQTFTVNSTAPQTVTVMAIDDAVAEGSEASRISHAVTASTSVSYPVGLPVSPIDAIVYDDELPPLIGVDLDCCTQTGPTNWTQPGFFDDQTNLTRDDGLTTNIDLDFTAFGSFNASTSGPVSTEIPQHNPSLAGIDGFVANTGAVTATWEDLTPGAMYGVYVFGYERRTGTYTQDVTITGATTLPTFTQTLNDDELQINDEVGGSGRTIVSFEHTVAANGAGQIVVAVTPGGGSAGTSLAGLALREIPVGAPPALSAIEGASLSYAEGVGGLEVSQTISVADADSNIQSAIVQVSTNFVATEDSLNVNGPLPVGITASGEGTGTITLSGSATPAQYETALRQITYANSSINPNGALTRTIGFQVADADSVSTILTRDVVVAPTQPADHLSLLTRSGRVPGNVLVVVSGGQLILFPDANDNGVFLSTDSNGDIVVAALGGSTVNGVSSVVAYAGTNTIPSHLKVISTAGTMLFSMDDVNVGGDLQVLSSDNDDAVEFYDVNVAGATFINGAGGVSHLTSTRTVSTGQVTVRSGTAAATATIADSRFVNSLIWYTSAGIDNVSFSSVQFDSSFVINSEGGTNNISFTDITVDGGSRITEVAGTAVIVIDQSQFSASNVIALGAQSDSITITSSTYTGQLSITADAGMDTVTISDTGFSSVTNIATGGGNDVVELSSVNATSYFSVNTGGESDGVTVNLSQLLGPTTVATESGADTLSSTDSGYGNLTNISMGSEGDGVTLLRVTSTGTFALLTEEDNDTVSADFLTIAGAFGVNIGGGTDDASVSNSGFQGIVNAVGETGANTFNLSTSTVALNANLVTLGGNTNLTLQQMQVNGTTFVSLGTVDDVLDIQNTTLFGDLLVNAGEGADVISVSDSNLRQQASLGTSGGADQINFTNVDADMGFALSTGSGIDTTVLNDLQVVLITSINTEGEADNVSLIDSGFGTQTVISTGSENDTLSLLRTTFNGPTSLKTEGGADTVTATTVSTTAVFTIDTAGDNDVIDWTAFTATAPVFVYPGSGNDSTRFTSADTNSGAFSIVPSSGNNIVDLQSGVYRDQLTVATLNGNLALRVRDNTTLANASFQGGTGAVDIFLDNGTNTFATSPHNIRFEDTSNSLIDELFGDLLGLAFP